LDSTRTRVGGRFVFGNKESVSGYVGLAWEYESSGDASGTYTSANGLLFRNDAPSLKGSSAYGEVGVRIQANDYISIDISAFGLAGQSKGGGGSASLVVTF
jgi:hypothetical protein